MALRHTAVDPCLALTCSSCVSTNIFEKYFHYDLLYSDTIKPQETITTLEHGICGSFYMCSWVMVTFTWLQNELFLILLKWELCINRIYRQKYFKLKTNSKDMKRTTYIIKKCNSSHSYHEVKCKTPADKRKKRLHSSVTVIDMWGERGFDTTSFEEHLS